MQTYESKKITARFFEALKALKELGIIRSKQAFATEYGLNRANMAALQHGKGTATSVHLSWLTYLILDFNVSADWLMTGRGEMFVGGKAPEKRQIPMTK